MSSVSASGGPSRGWSIRQTEAINILQATKKREGKREGEKAELVRLLTQIISGKQFDCLNPIIRSFPKKTKDRAWVASVWISKISLVTKEAKIETALVEYVFLLEDIPLEVLFDLYELLGRDFQLPEGDYREYPLLEIALKMRREAFFSLLMDKCFGELPLKILGVSFAEAMIFSDFPLGLICKWVDGRGPDLGIVDKKRIISKLIEKNNPDSFIFFWRKWHKEFSDEVCLDFIKKIILQAPEISKEHFNDDPRKGLCLREDDLLGHLKRSGDTFATLFLLERVTQELLSLVALPSHLEKPFGTALECVESVRSDNSLLRGLAEIRDSLERTSVWTAAREEGLSRIVSDLETKLLDLKTSQVKERKEFSEALKARDEKIKSLSAASEGLNGLKERNLKLQEEIVLKSEEIKCLESEIESLKVSNLQLAAAGNHKDTQIERLKKAISQSKGEGPENSEPELPSPLLSASPVLSPAENVSSLTAKINELEGQVELLRAQLDLETRSLEEANKKILEQEQRLVTQKISGEYQEIYRRKLPYEGTIDYLAVNMKELDSLGSLWLFGSALDPYFQPSDLDFIWLSSQPMNSERLAQFSSGLQAKYSFSVSSRTGTGMGGEYHQLNISSFPSVDITFKTLRGASSEEFVRDRLNSESILHKKRILHWETKILYSKGNQDCLELDLDRTEGYPWEKPISLDMTSSSLPLHPNLCAYWIKHLALNRRPLGENYHNFLLFLSSIAEDPRQQVFFLNRVLRPALRLIFEKYWDTEAPDRKNLLWRFLLGYRLFQICAREEHFFDPFSYRGGRIAELLELLPSPESPSKTPPKSPSKTPPKPPSKTPPKPPSLWVAAVVRGSPPPMSDGAGAEAHP